MINTTKNDYSLDNVNRTTAWGKILRRSKIDELPQLINIILGDMRFIGPRPEIPYYVDKKKFDFLNQLHPGLSDYSSILFRDEEGMLTKIQRVSPYETILPLKIALAQYYCSRKGFWQDLNLVIITILSIFLPKYTCNKFILPIIKTHLQEWHGFYKKIF